MKDIVLATARRLVGLAAMLLFICAGAAPLLVLFLEFPWNRPFLAFCFLVIGALWFGIQLLLTVAALEWGEGIPLKETVRGFREWLAVN